MMELSLLVTLVTIVTIGAFSTYFLSEIKHFDAVRASVAMTLIFLLFFEFLPIDWPKASDALFFGGTFIGMSNGIRMKAPLLFISSMLFVLFFQNISPHINGMGGGLGLAAFLSVVPVSITFYLYSKIKKAS